jgi:hypothetical protein
MGQLIEVGTRINGRYNATRGLGPWATLAEAERGRSALQTELAYKQKYIEYLENRNAILADENKRLTAQQKKHLQSKMRDYARPRPAESGMNLAIMLATGAVLGVMLAVAAVVLA